MLAEQEKAWVEECLCRLRLVQADGAELTAEKRAEDLSEEFNRKLRELPKPSQKRVLAALLEQIPVDGNVPRAVVPPTTPIPEPIVEKPPVANFEEVRDCFIRMAKDLSVTERAALVRLLVQEELAPAQGGLGAETIEKVRLELKLRADQLIRAERLEMLLVALVVLLRKADDAAREAVEKLMSGPPRAEKLTQVLIRFLTSEQAPAPLIWPLQAAILEALRNGGLAFGTAYLEHMAPEVIWEVATDGVMVFKVEAAWKEFKERAKEYDTPPKINQKVRIANRAVIETELRKP